LKLSHSALLEALLSDEAMYLHYSEDGTHCISNIAATHHNHTKVFDGDKKFARDQWVQNGGKLSEFETFLMDYINTEIDFIAFELEGTHNITVEFTP
jgi:hypothetical protein